MLRNHLHGRYLGVMLGIIMAMVTTGSVLAEGYWTSYIDGARSEFSSRSWHDSNNDNISTAIEFDGCRAWYYPTSTSDNVQVALYREIPFWPDDEIGRPTLYCYYSATAYYGDVQSGDYHFSLKNINGRTDQRIDVSYVRTDY